MPELALFQDAFTAALRGDLADVQTWLQQPDSPGLSVYRNTVTSGAVDTLASIFPTVGMMVGTDWFRAAAARFATETPPTRPSMLDYGEDFPAWLAAFPPAADTPYLGLIAHIDWLWWEAHFAGDADPLAADALASLAECDLDRCRLKLHPAVRLASFDQSLASLWLAHQHPTPTPSDFSIETRAEFLLLTRESLSVRARLIDAAAFEFLAACAEGASLLSSATRAMNVNPSASLPEVVRIGLEAGAFTCIETISGDPAL